MYSALQEEEVGEEYEESEEEENEEVVRAQYIRENIMLRSQMSKLKSELYVVKT